MLRFAVRKDIRLECEPLRINRVEGGRRFSMHARSLHVTERDATRD